ncbi:MAG TPA: bifunctional DNA-formamidopyrimidine glycosylase/DNA-(apurinic or apyrimidinic site) lyase [Actinomycetota bacterium]|nr:bifunctional DNA-formamidopyrimidine glycosylase/DNA-(apurinic or apyrimidinic site) lyase [Actinomycetota bacterium]
MPELPEIEVLKRDLEKEVVGRRIKEAEVRPGSNAMRIVSRHGRRKEFQELLEGAKVEKVERSGKLLLLELDSARVLVVDLGRTGILVKTSASEEVVTHTHIVLAFTIGGQLRLIDTKHTAKVFVAPLDELQEIIESQPFMIDPLTHQFTWHYFSQLLEERASSMKELMSDEKFICGLGDIYSDEVLFAAGLRYDRSSDKLTSQDVRRLYRALMEILQDAVKARGTTWGSAQYRDLQGEPGTFQLELKVYEREGEPCRRCRQDIVKEKWSGNRITYFCPQCQT